MEFNQDNLRHNYIVGATSFFVHACNAPAQILTNLLSLVFLAWI